jgi:hypothetical protein
MMKMIDKNVIFDRCMKFLGKNCANLALPLMPEFLCLHPYFDTPEPEMDDPACILDKLADKLLDLTKFNPFLMSTDMFILIMELLVSSLVKM